MLRGFSYHKLLFSPGIRKGVFLSLFSCNFDYDHLSQTFLQICGLMYMFGYWSSVYPQVTKFLFVYLRITHPFSCVTSIVQRASEIQSFRPYLKSIDRNKVAVHWNKEHICRFVWRKKIGATQTLKREICT